MLQRFHPLKSRFPKRDSAVEVKVAAHDEADRMKRRKAIEQYKENLRAYRVDIRQLPDLCPTEPGARRDAIHAARVMVEDHQLRALFSQTRRLPADALAARPGVASDVVVTYPAYVTAMALLFMSGPQVTGIMGLE
ncbi:hypothetical protein JI721_04950 [Alicyclobacillus cycloheptanicus]|uniref:Uncharacterized protein n=1 Tax=Alicyclobacillus cycloheptanicus TaxID=1457 RepID=A0ABT9XJH5_9BACL|nr:hypothetical protein [Alicyclobacillus cycloheptanicus]MDQ0189933.1 hypothetical protein [Alicyclobacillus cycloheptanicus]WDM02166.1 hypothetical protein JI721_04950 [Alicyclobacillus cycloheptanicus]